jgi:hypothetical protein
MHRRIQSWVTPNRPRVLHPRVNLAVTAHACSQVLTDEAELDYEALVQ